MKATEKFNVIDPFVRKIKRAKDDADIIAILTECADIYADFVMEEDVKKKKDKAKETNPDRDKNDIKVSKDCTFVDWNKFSMDELADYLENKWLFMSSGEAFAICKMVKFYREHKDKN
jgi:hypothetical protein